MARREPAPDPRAVLTPTPDDDLHAAMREAQALALAAQAAVSYADPSALVAELCAAGFPEDALARHFVGEVMTLAASGILCAHLPRPYDAATWERIVRSLTRREARAALAPLAWAYRIERDPARRWLLANALSAMATFAEVGALPEIAQYESLFHAGGLVPPHARTPGGGR